LLKNKKFVIPVMQLQDLLTRFVETPSIGNPDYIDMILWLYACARNNKDNWGLKGKWPYFRIKIDLEKQWYPVVIIYNRWFANAFIEGWLFNYIKKKRSSKRGKKN